MSTALSACRQEVDSEDNVRVIDFHRRREITKPPSKSGAPPVTLQDNLTWSQIDIPASATKQGERARGPELHARRAA